jgi:predicted DNA-binding transcriptional regulator AlpA
MKASDLVSVAEAMEIYGCSRSRIYQLIEEGRLKPIVEMPRKKLFLQSDIKKIADEVTPRRKRRGSRKQTEDETKTILLRSCSLGVKGEISREEIYDYLDEREDGAR